MGKNIKGREATPEDWARGILARWRRSIEGIIETGQHLRDAKTALGHGKFMSMVSELLPFKIGMAERLMAIAEHPSITNSQSTTNLPASWSILGELARLDPPEFDAKVSDGTIHPGMSQLDAKALAKVNDKNPAAAPPEGEAHTPMAADAGAPPQQDSEELSDQQGGYLGPQIEPPDGAHDAGRAHPATAADADGAHPASDAGNAGRREDGGVPLSSSPAGQSLPNGHRAIAPSRSEPSDSLDFFPTPPYATRALIERVLPRLGIRHTDSTRISYCLEPACGEGHMAEVLSEYIDHVVIGDIHNYGYGAKPCVQDFLDPDIEEKWDWIITNPPFGDKSLPFLLRALELATIGVAVFVRSQWAVEGISKYEQVYRDRPPTLFAPFMERVNLCKGRWDPDGTTATAYCWLVWVKNKAPKPPYWIPPGCRESLTRPDDVERFTAHPVKRKEYNPASDAARGGEARSGNAEMESIGPPRFSSGEMPDIPSILDRRGEKAQPSS